MSVNRVYTLDIKEFANNDRSAVCTIAHGYDSAVPHSHNFIEMVYVKKGIAYNNVDGKNIPIKQGDLIVMAKKEIVHFIKPKDPDNFEIINILIPYSLFDVDVSKIKPSIVFSNNTIDTLSQTIETIANEQAEQKPGYNNIINSYSLILLQSISRFCTSLVDYGKKKKGQKTNFVELAKRYIDDNFRKPINIDDISFACGCSKSYLQELFKKHSYKSMKQYLISVRIVEATHLLLKSTKTIEEVSEACGFCDTKYFYKLFSEEYKMTPAVYRKKFQEKIA